MGDHYIPQFYLRGFAEGPEFRSIFMYEKGASYHIHTNLRNVAQQTRLYSRQLESYSANSVESPAKPILDKIIAREPITEFEHSFFVTFIVAMLRRVPSHKDMVGKWLDENAELCYNQFELEIRNLGTLHPDKKAVLEGQLAELDVLRKEKRITPETVWHQLLSSEPLPDVSRALEHMSWQFLTTDEDSFLTSDKPVFFFRERGVGRMNSEVTFPVSSSIALLATWQSKTPCGFRSATNQQIQEINR